MKATTVVIRDVLLLALRERNLPMTTSELAQVAPWQRCEHRHNHRWYHRDPEPGDRYRLISCDGETCIVDYQTNVYPHLRALESFGLLERIRVEGIRHAWWRLVPQHSPEEPVDLEALFAL